MSIQTNIPDSDDTSLRQQVRERFGKYALVGPIGRGGMAELLLAVQEGEGVEGFAKVVAIKRVLQTQADSTAFVQMFLDEARLAARLDHPNVVRIYDVGQVDGRHFLTMEYLPGEDLGRLCTAVENAGQRIDCNIAAAIISNAAEGLHFAHELTDSRGLSVGLVHRDISPTNIIVTYYGHVKIVDFGIAKAANNTFRTEAGMLKGKAAYFAPEQVSNTSIDRRCDIYGLGIVLWEMVAGQRLFMRETHPATLAAAAIGEIADLRAARPDVEPALERIVYTALARDPAERYQTAAQLHEALDAYLFERGGVSARDLGAWLEGVFGAQRANLKRTISRGVNLDIMLDQLIDLDEAGVKATAIHQRPPSRAIRGSTRPWWHVAGFGAAAAVVTAGSLLLTQPSRAPAVPVGPTASLTIDGPKGGQVFLNGEPTGRTAPTTIHGLSPDQPIEVQVQVEGHVRRSETMKPRGVSDLP